MEDHAQALDELKDYVELIGDEVSDTYDLDGEDYQRGWICEHGDWVYSVTGFRDSQYITVSFGFSIINNIGGLFNEDDAQSYLKNRDPADHDIDVTTLAALELMERMDASLHQEFQYRLVDELTSTDVSYSLENTPSGRITGFQVSRKIFPDDPSFDLTEFNHSVQTVITSGLSGVHFVSTSFDFESLIDAGLDDGEDEHLRYIN